MCSSLYIYIYIERERDTHVVALGVVACLAYFLCSVGDAQSPPAIAVIHSLIVFTCLVVLYHLFVGLLLFIIVLIIRF